jgi:hypothetical protein
VLTHHDSRMGDGVCIVRMKRISSKVGGLGGSFFRTAPRAHQPFDVMNACGVPGPGGGQARTVLWLCRTVGLLQFEP